MRNGISSNEWDGGGDGDMATAVESKTDRGIDHSKPVHESYFGFFDTTEP